MLQWRFQLDSKLLVQITYNPNLNLPTLLAHNIRIVSIHLINVVSYETRLQTKIIFCHANTSRYMWIASIYLINVVSYGTRWQTKIDFLSTHHKSEKNMIAKWCFGVSILVFWEFTWTFMFVFPFFFGKGKALS
jgi:hypothetical protein